MESNRMIRRMGSNHGESSGSKAKINLVITNKRGETRAKEAAIKLGPASLPQQPTAILSLNSVDTVDSHPL